MVKWFFRVFLLSFFCSFEASAATSHIEALQFMPDEAQKHRVEIYQLESFQIHSAYLEFQIEEKIPDKKLKLLSTAVVASGEYKNPASIAGGLKAWIDKDLPLDTVFGEIILNQKILI